MNRRLLVVGARPDSLGWNVAEQASFYQMFARPERWEVVTAGIDNEDVSLDATEWVDCESVMREHGPFQAVVCTVGVNYECSVQELPGRALEDSLLTNVGGPMNLLSAWLRHPDFQEKGHFVAISSNSARIARSESIAYCASKAALSMALRCAAREVAPSGVSVYGYEPGWLKGTPMSAEVAERLSKQYKGLPSSERPVSLHRIPSGSGVDTEALARMIVQNLDHHGDLNGCLIRVDGGEQ